MHIFGVIIGVGLVIAVFKLVRVAATHKIPELKEPPPNMRPSNEWIRTAYTATMSLYIEVDREIWQVSTIFMTASILVMGWVVTNLDKLTKDVTVVIGCASIILVGMATLFKFRLRKFNLVHIENLKRIEQAALDGNIDAANYWGVYHMRNCLRADKYQSWWQRRTSIHGLMEVYLVLFTVIWLAIWMVQK